MMGKIAVKIALTVAAVLSSAPTLILASWPQMVEARQLGYFCGIPHLIWAGVLSLILLGIVALIAIVFVNKQQGDAA